VFVDLFEGVRLHAETATSMSAAHAVESCFMQVSYSNQARVTPHVFLKIRSPRRPVRTPYTQSVIARRFATLVLMTVMATAPVVLEICLAACERHDHTASGPKAGGHAAACHEAAETPQPASSASGACVHGDLPGAAQIAERLIGPAFDDNYLILVSAFVPVPSPQSGWSESSPDATPPDRIAQTAQLRL
jgi:hypothetical protein